MKRIKALLATIICICIITGLTGCAANDDYMNDVKGNLSGNSYTIYTYDNYGQKVLTTTGDKINIAGNKTKSKGYDGDTCIFEQKGLKPEVDFTQEDIISHSTGKISENTYIAGIVNYYKNYFGKSRIVVIKSQLGQPIAAYSGDEVFWKIPDDLPKMTKLMIDGKALYIHRANFQIIDKELMQ